MYERMLNKNIRPTYEEMGEYCKESEKLFLLFNDWITKEFCVTHEIVFPYGNNYGWGIKYQIKRKLLCNVFPENNSFTIMIRLTNNQYKSVYNQVQIGTKKVIDNYYPCNDGGWIHYRILNREDFEDIKKIVIAKK